MSKTILAFALAAGLSTIAMAAEFKGTIIDEKCSTIASMKGVLLGRRIGCNCRSFQPNFARV